MMPVNPTLVLTGTHSEYRNFLKSRNIPFPTQMYYEGGSAGVVGRHFSRIVVTEGFRCNREDAGTIFAISRAALEVGGKVAYHGLLPGWTQDKWDTQGDPVLRDADGKLRCNWCRQACNETYRGGFCYTCGKEKKMATKKYGPGSTQWKLLPMGKVTTASPLTHKEGDIWKLPKSNSPMWTDQWGYQGSAKAPYIVSKKDEGHSNGSTTADGWACSCMSFTRHTPRTPCKHILNVMMKEGLGQAGKKTLSKVGLATLTDADESAFLEWKRQQAALKVGNVPTAGAKLNLFGATTRKFR